MKAAEMVARKRMYRKLLKSNPGMSKTDAKVIASTLVDQAVKNLSEQANG